MAHSMRALPPAGMAVLGAAILATIASGTTFAATSSSAAGYRACVNRHGTLALQKHGKCPAGDHAVRIGASGPAGRSGPAGPAVAPHFYEGYADNVDLPVDSDDGTPVTSLTLPAGKYDVAYTVDLLNVNGGSVDMDCWADASHDGLVMNENYQTLANEAWGDVTDDNAVQLSTAQTVTLSCDPEDALGAGAVTAQYAHFVATPVSAVN